MECITDILFSSDVSPVFISYKYFSFFLVGREGFIGITHLSKEKKNKVIVNACEMLNLHFITGI